MIAFDLKNTKHRVSVSILLLVASLTSIYFGVAWLAFVMGTAMAYWSVIAGVHGIEGSLIGDVMQIKKAD